ncbi:uncharacterized protein LOC126728180 [Quercus robur]|uniref:uncharacterized protein LOC126728180 n=1 Tax=Quercus robur TaxID=38942 RepID=UPI0021637DC5|nr:uncharacterized protein LOC126728180 [Quercus robur]
MEAYRPFKQNDLFLSLKRYLTMVAQPVFVAEEWVRNASNEANAEALSRADVEKSLEALKQEKVELFKKLKEADKARLSTETGLKTVERQLVIDLKVELQKAKEAGQLAKEATEAEKQASYLLGMEEMQVRLAEELLEVCRDYYNVTWDKALSVARVPVDSGAEGDKDKGKEKEKKPSSEAKNATKDKEAAAKVKEAEAKTKEADPKAKDAPTSQSRQKEDPPAPKAKA